MFYQRLEALIKSSGKKQVEFLRDTGINRGTLGQWRTRGSIPNAETIQKIADYFGVSVAYLLGKEDKEEAATEAAGAIPNFEKLTEANKEKVREYVELLLTAQK